MPAAAPGLKIHNPNIIIFRGYNLLQRKPINVLITALSNTKNNGADFVCIYSETGLKWPMANCYLTLHHATS